MNQRSYKGSLRVLAQGEKLLVVNQLELETYLASVLPAKTMVVWPDEAVKAQAVAARSYALYKKQHSSGAYDIKALDKELTYFGTGSRLRAVAIVILNGLQIADRITPKLRRTFRASRNGEGQRQ